MRFNSLLLFCLSILPTHLISIALGAVEDANKPIQAATKHVILDTLSGWEIPQTQSLKFEGQLPLHNASGSAIKGRFDKEAIYVVSEFAGLKTIKAGEKWSLETQFPDKVTGRYTYLVEKDEAGLKVRGYGAQVGSYLGKEFALVDVNSNGRFDDAGTDVLVYDKKTQVKVGDPFLLGTERLEIKVAASGQSATFAKPGMGFGGAAAFKGAMEGGGADTSIEGGMETWNSIRASLGVPPLKRDPKLEEAAYKHIEYMKAVGNLQHEEDKSHPKYTPEGARSGMGSCLGRGGSTPRAAILSQLQCFLHRIPLIMPELEFTTLAFDPESHYSGFDYSGGPRRRNVEWPGPIAYPPDGASDFGPYWSGNEGPCPIPGGPPAGGVGQPITLTFPHRQRLKGGKLTLTDPAGAEVEGWLSAPDKPAVSMFGDNCNTVCFIAKAPLKTDTLYTAKVEGKLNGVDFTKTWKFTTAKTAASHWGGRGGGRGGGKGGK